MVKNFNEEGTLTGFAIIALLIIGSLVIYGSLKWIDNYYFRVFGYGIGMAAFAGAGYGGQAKALGLRAFGQSEWRSAKSSYNREPSPRAGTRSNDRA